jgi:TonB family protein
LSNAEYGGLKKAWASDPKVAPLDPKGIAKGVMEGSTENDVGGAGGKALRNDGGDLLDAYDAMFRQRLRERFEAPPGLSDTLKGQFEIRSNPDGSITGVRVVTSSGNREFDQAVMEAIKQVPMPARPDHKSEVVRFFFTMKDQSEG